MEYLSLRKFTEDRVIQGAAEDDTTIDEFLSQFESVNATHRPPPLANDNDKMIDDHETVRDVIGDDDEDLDITDDVNFAPLSAAEEAEYISVSHAIDEYYTTKHKTHSA